MTAAAPPPALGPDTTWIVRLRWALTATQFLTVMFVDRLSGSHLHLRPALALIAVGAASNAAFRSWLARARFVREPTLGLVLAFDVVLLTALLTEGGGYSSPLSFLYLVEVAVAAVALGRAWSSAIIVLSFACSLALVFHHSSQAGHHASAVDVAHREHALLHLEGMWIAFAVIGTFVARVKRALAAREAELAAERALGARTEKLASLATLAAGAAHELATPLATIATAAKELEIQLDGRGEAGGGAAADARLIRQQVERCRGILNKMAAEAGASSADPAARLRVSQLIDAALADLPGRRRVRVSLDPAAGESGLEAPPLALAQALRSALENAVEASPAAEEILLRARVAGAAVRIEVSDKGQGMSPEVRTRAGEPFFTTKQPGEGMGLGLFLTRTVVERLGGGLHLDSAPGGGTTAVLTIPLAPARGETAPPARPEPAEAG